MIIQNNKNRQINYKIVIIFPKKKKNYYFILFFLLFIYLFIYLFTIFFNFLLFIYKNKLINK